MDKIQLTVLGISATPASNSAYALVLKEVDGNRKLPIMIGAFEAQAIALEIEGVVPPRPMTHDLIKNVLDNLNVTLSEIYIYDLVEGTFFAKLIFEDHSIEIDARPSDAIAISVRTGAPIFINNDILEETAVQMQIDEPQQGNEMDDEDEDMTFIKKQAEKPAKPKTKLEQLQNDLEKAIKDENYEKAAKLRDEINQLIEKM